MDSNETNRPLTEVPMDKTPETLVSSPAQAEENNTMYVPVSYTHLTLPTKLEV